MPLKPDQTKPNQTRNRKPKHFSAITPRPTLIWNGYICRLKKVSFKTYLYSFGPG